MLSFIYDIDAVKMSNIIKGCFNERGTINKEELRKSARNYYQFDNGGVLPTIIDNSQPEYLRKPIGDTSKRAKMIYTFETISPREFLINLNKGSDPTRRDLKLVEDLLIDYKLKPGVVNVLIDYMLSVNEKKLTRGLAETLAGEWQRLGIETVEEAMNVCEKEFKKRNLVKGDVSEEMGHNRNYISDVVRRKTIPRHAVVFLHKNYNIELKDYEAVQEEKKADKPKREERAMKDMTDKQMYQLIYSAVYHAVKKAWSE